MQPLTTHHTMRNRITAVDRPDLHEYIRFFSLKAQRWFSQKLPRHLSPPMALCGFPFLLLFLVIAKFLDWGYCSTVKWKCQEGQRKKLDKLYKLAFLFCAVFLKFGIAFIIIALLFFTLLLFPLFIIHCIFFLTCHSSVTLSYYILPSRSKYKRNPSHPSTTSR